MITMQTIMDQLTGKGIVEALIGAMKENFQEFVQEQKQYEYAMRALQESLGEEGSPSVCHEMEAIQQQMASDLLFSGLLGFKANLDNYIDPVARSFLDADPEKYLREDIAHRLPQYKSAQQVRDRFYAQLTPAQRDQYDAVTTYVTHLETVGPKLAHYYGYLFGNQLLPLVVPGYAPDTVQTFQYRMMLERYFERKLK